MTKSDKKRVKAALLRWRDRFTAIDNNASIAPSDYLMGAVNWLRSLAKLGNEYLEDGADDWADEHLVHAAMLVVAECRKLEEIITAEAKNL